MLELDKADPQRAYRKPRRSAGLARAADAGQVQARKGDKADDKDEMVKRLKAQGIDVSGVSIAYGDKGKPDKGDKKGAAPPTLSGGRKANPSFQSSFSLAHHG